MNLKYLDKLFSFDNYTSSEFKINILKQGVLTPCRDKKTQVIEHIYIKIEIKKTKNKNFQEEKLEEINNVNVTWVQYDKFGSF